jgi:hypothetical protein
MYPICIGVQATRGDSPFFCLSLGSIDRGGGNRSAGKAIGDNCGGGGAGGGSITISSVVSVGSWTFAGLGGTEQSTKCLIKESLDEGPSFGCVSLWYTGGSR